MNKQMVIAFLNEFIKSNGLQEITGSILNSALTAIANIIPDEAMLTSSFGGGIDEDSVEPANQTEPIWYFAKGGNYTNFGGYDLLSKNLNIILFNGSTWQKVEIELPSNTAEKVFNPLDDENPSTMKASYDFVKDLIVGDGDLSVLQSNIVADFEKIDFLNVGVRKTGVYMGDNGEEIANASCSYFKFHVKKGQAYNLKFNTIQGASSFVNINYDNTIYAYQSYLPDNRELKIIYGTVKDGYIYINQNIINENIAELSTINYANTVGSSVVDYIDSKFIKIEDSEPSNNLITHFYEGVYQDIALVSNIDNGFNNSAPFFTSEVIEVKKGFTILVSGRIGSISGLLFFNTDGSYSHPLLIGERDVVDERVEILEDGFVRLSTTMSSNAAIKIIKKKITQGIDIEDSIKPFFSEKYYHLPVRPKFATLKLKGTLPTDETPTRTPTELEFDFFVGNEKQFSAKCELSIQGHASATYPKKGYTFDVYNMNGDGLSLKFGDMVAIDSFHLKAYQTDATHTRDVALGRIWRDIIGTRPYPISKVNNIPFALNPTDKNAAYISDAKYHTEGFPVEIILNGTFLGLYTFRNKKSRENYALNSKDKNHIFLDSYDYYALFASGWLPDQWEVKNPKMTGYVEGGVIPNATVNTSVNRFFSWAKDFINNIGDARANATQYIVKENWIDYVLFAESVWHNDSTGNNLNIITWDNAKWSICPYDMDNSIGLNAWSNFTIETNKTGFVQGDIFATIRTVYQTEIKARYTSLRKSGLLTAENLSNYFNEIAENIPRDIYQKDFEKWTNLWTNGKPTLEQIYLFLDNRLKWLDTQWLNP